MLIWSFAYFHRHTTYRSNPIWLGLLAFFYSLLRSVRFNNFCSSSVLFDDVYCVFAKQQINEFRRAWIRPTHMNGMNIRVGHVCVSAIVSTKMECTLPTLTVESCMNITSVRANMLRKHIYKQMFQLVSICQLNNYNKLKNWLRATFPYFAKSFRMLPLWKCHYIWNCQKLCRSFFEHRTFACLMPRFYPWGFALEFQWKRVRLRLSLPKFICSMRINNSLSRV